MVSLSTHLSRLMLRVNMDRVSRWTLKSNLMITCMSDILNFHILNIGAILFCVQLLSRRDDCRRDSTFPTHLTCSVIPCPSICACILWRAASVLFYCIVNLEQVILRSEIEENKAQRWRAHLDPFFAGLTLQI